MKKFNDTLKATLLTLALDANFYGKRLKDKKLELVEALPEFKKFNANDLVDWLNNNKPAKPASKKRECNKQAASTMTGNETRQRDNIAVIEGSRFIVTSAQNNSVPASVLAQLEMLALRLDAQLIILPTYYNKKAFSATVESEDEFFDEAIKSYLILDDHWLGFENGVKVAAQANIPLTAKQPINAAQTLNNGELVTIVGHPKIQQRTLLRMAGEDIKTAWSTGSCTAFNYLRGRAGSEAENYHGFGGLLVQISDDDKCFVTNLTQSQDGSIMFMDYDQRLNTIGCEYEPSAPVVVVGDSHFEQFDSLCFEQVKQLLINSEAKLAVIHDAAHSESRNHHNVGKGSHWYKSKDTSIFIELKFIIDRINDYANICSVYLVESNHNAVIDGWLDSQATSNNIMFDTVNSKLFYLLKYLVCEAIDNKQDHKALMVAFENADLTGLPPLADNVQWGSAHIPEVHYNVGVESHGHKGANGAAKGLTNGKISQSMVLGHTHSPEISYLTSRGGILTVGHTAAPDQGYNRGGGSSWAQSSSIIHANGIPQQFFHNL